MRQDESFGIVPLSKASGSWEVFLIQHRHGRYWGFPKGHAEKGESAQESALRELKEETNLDCIRVLQPEPFVEQYQFSLDSQWIVKQVFYFAAEVTGDVILQKKEILAGIWISLPNALKKITHLEGRAILKQVEGILSNSS